MRALLKFCFVFFVCAFSAHFSSSAENVQSPHVEVELLSELATAQPNQEFWLALRFKIEKHWHIYWANPGDSGTAPKIIWQKPDTVDISDIHWPTPERIEVGSLVNYGYKDEVYLLSKIKVKAPFQKKLSLKATVKWLVCETTCIPGKAQLEKTLSISENTSNASSESKAIATAAAALPQPLSLNLKVTEATNQIFIENVNNAKQAFFFPLDAETIDYADKQNFSDGRLTLKKSQNAPEAISQLNGVLILDSNAFEMHSAVTKSTEPTPAPTLKTDIGFLSAVFFAFFGGIILNLMPCVFPILSLKAFSLAAQAGEKPSDARKHGWAYTLGIIASFWLLTLLLIFLKSGGEKLGWGFQLQSPTFIALLALLMFGMGLNLLGVFEWSGRFMSAGQSLTNKEGFAGSFFTGVLATVVATPCTAPFMGTAIGYAFTQSSFVILSIFTALGFGLALPYLLLSYSPLLSNALPRPGRWMESFKQFLSFPMFATCIWLVWVFGLQTSFDSVFLLLIALLLLSLAAWIYGHWKNLSRLAFVAIALVLMVFTLKKALAFTYSAQSTASTEKIEWKKYDPDLLKEEARKGNYAFVDFTAAWCVTCKLNEKVALDAKEVVHAFHERNISAYKADWTNADPQITEALASFGRNGVPLYLLYKPTSATPIILPQILTPTLILNELKEN